MPAVISAAEAAARLGKSTKTLRRWCRLKLIPSTVTPGGEYLIPKAAVRALLPKAEPKRPRETKAARLKREAADLAAIAAL